jgi:hypothetical protein
LSFFLSKQKGKLILGKLYKEVCDFNFCKVTQNLKEYVNLWMFYILPQEDRQL